MSSDNHAALTAAQRSAVEHINGPLLIIAGPGSGKTRVVTHRIAHLLDQGVPAPQIVALTFTNKAADEMRGRVEQLVPGQSVWLGTFHRFCARLLRQYAGQIGLAEHFTIYDTNDSLRSLRHVLEKIDHDATTFTPRQMAAEISRAKNELIEAERYEPRIGSPLSNVVAEVYPAYQQQLLQSSAVDFDDLLLHVAVLVRDNPEIRRSLDERFRYVLIDEYQDTNYAQYAILRALCHDHRNLAATGDPDQSIFGWRGANLSNILQFEQDFPDVHVVRLEQNYRSTKRILRAADALIANNLMRKHKRLFTDNLEGDPVKLVRYRDEKEEADAIAAGIAHEIHSGRRRPRDFAIFYRVNALSRALELAFSEHGIPYQLVKGLEFFQRKEIKDVLAYLQLIGNPRDDVALLRVINTPPRGIGKKTVSRLVEQAARRGLSLLDAAREAGMIESMTKRTATLVAKFVTLYDQLTEAAGSSIEHLLGMVISLSGYQDHLNDSQLPEDQDRLANVEELLTVARDFDERHPEAGSLELFLEETALVGDTDDWETQVDRVTLMTLHAAKGLEFPAVFLIAAEEGLLPHERSRDNPQELEEERRLIFVGITRAQQQLQISTAHRRGFRGQRKLTIPSQFLMELPREDMEVLQADWYDDSDPWEEDMPYEASPDEAPVFRLEEQRPQPGSAADLADVIAPAATAPNRTSQQTNPEKFRVGMPVVHPDYGLGKVAALSGVRDKRTATVNFVTAGKRTFRLKESPLRPAGGMTKSQ